MAKIWSLRGSGRSGIGPTVTSSRSATTGGRYGVRWKSIWPSRSMCRSRLRSKGRKAIRVPPSPTTSSSATGVASSIRASLTATPLAVPGGRHDGDPPVLGDHCVGMVPRHGRIVDREVGVAAAPDAVAAGEHHQRTSRLGAGEDVGGDRPLRCGHGRWTHRRRSQHELVTGDDVAVADRARRFERGSRAHDRDPGVHGLDVEVPGERLRQVAHRVVRLDVDDQVARLATRGKHADDQLHAAPSMNRSASVVTLRAPRRAAGSVCDRSSGTRATVRRGCACGYRRRRSRRTDVAHVRRPAVRTGCAVDLAQEAAVIVPWAMVPSSSAPSASIRSSIAQIGAVVPLQHREQRRVQAVRALRQDHLPQTRVVHRQRVVAELVPEHVLGHVPAVRPRRPGSTTPAHRRDRSRACQSPTGCIGIECGASSSDSFDVGRVCGIKLSRVGPRPGT